MITQRTKVSLALFILAGFTCAGLWLAQSPSVEGRTPPVKQARQVEGPLAGLNQKVKTAKGKDANAVRDLTNEVVTALSPDEVPLFAQESAKERVSRAEVSYREGATKGISEVKVAQTINELADKLALPDYSRVSVAMVRTTRMSLMLQMPDLVAQPAPNERPARKKIGSAISPFMSPLEATALTMFVLQQKTHNEDFQLSHDDFYANLQKKQVAKWEELRAQRDAGARNLVDSQPGPTMQVRSNPKTEETLQAIKDGAAKMSADDLLKLGDSSLDTLGIKR